MTNENKKTAQELNRELSEAQRDAATCGHVAFKSHTVNTFKWGSFVDDDEDLQVRLWSAWFDNDMEFSLNEVAFDEDFDVVFKWSVTTQGGHVGHFTGPYSEMTSAFNRISAAVHDLQFVEAEVMGKVQDFVDTAVNPDTFHLFPTG